MKRCIFGIREVFTYCKYMQRRCAKKLQILPQVELKKRDFLQNLSDLGTVIFRLIKHQNHSVNSEFERKFSKKHEKKWSSDPICSLILTKQSFINTKKK